MMVYSCDHCAYSTTRKFNMERHYQNKHQYNTPRAPTTVSVGQVGGQVPTTMSVGQDGGCAPTTVSTSTCESKAPSRNQMEVPEIRPLDTNQVHHPAPDQHQQYNERSLRSSEGSPDKFDRFYQALHGKTPNVNHKSNCGYPQCTREWSNDIDKVCKEFNNIGVECFTKCSDKEVNSVCFIASTMMMSFVI